MAQQAELWYDIGHASALKYDGEGFVAAMEKALDLGAPEGLVYPELAYPDRRSEPACGSNAWTTAWSKAGSSGR